MKNKFEEIRDRESLEELEEIIEIKNKKKLIKEIFFDESDNYWKRKDKINSLIKEFLEKENFEEIFNVSKEILNEYVDDHGMERILDLDTTKNENAVLLTEAVNWAAKEIDDLFYELKPSLIISSWKSGAILGVVEEDGRWPIYYLQAENVGVASFHDPNYEVEELNELLNKKEEHGGNKIPNWTHGWSGVKRQNEAFELIKAMTRKIDDKEKEFYLKKMAIKTSPGDSLYEKFKNSKEPKALENNEYSDGEIFNKIEF